MIISLVFISLTFDSAVNNKLFDTFLNHNFTVRELNLSQGSGTLNLNNFDCVCWNCA